MHISEGRIRDDSVKHGIDLLELSSTIMKLTRPEGTSVNGRIQTAMVAQAHQ